MALSTSGRIDMKVWSTLFALLMFGCLANSRGDIRLARGGSESVKNFCHFLTKLGILSDEERTKYSNNYK